MKVATKLKKGSEVRVKKGSHKKYSRVKPTDIFTGVVAKVKKDGIMEVQFLDEETVDTATEGAYDIDIHQDDLVPTGEIVPLFYGN